MRLWLGLVLVLGCSGCTALSEEPAAPDRQTPTEILSRRLDDAGLTAFVKGAYPNWNPGKWDADALTLAALYFNPEIASARTKLEVARAGETTAGQRPNPTLSVTPGYDSSHASPWFVGLNVNWPIETGNKRELRIERSQHLTDAAKYQIATAAWHVRAKVIRTLIDLHTARAAIDLYRNQAANLKRMLDVYAARSAQGQLQSEAATQSTINYQQALLNEGGAVKRFAEAQAQLAAAIGVSLAAVENIRIDTSALVRRPAEVPATLEAALARHNDLLAALAEYAAAHKTLQLELAKQIPDINIGPGYEWNGDYNKFTLGLSVTIPLLNNNEGPIAEAEAKRRLAADAFNALQADIIGRVETARAGLNAAIRILATTDRLVRAQREEIDHLKTRLHAGEASQLPLIMAQIEVDSAAVTRYNALVSVLDAQASLEEALQQRLFGQVFDSDLASAGKVVSR